MRRQSSRWYNIRQVVQLVGLPIGSRCFRLGPLGMTGRLLGQNQPANQFLGLGAIGGTQADCRERFEQGAGDGVNHASRGFGRRLLARRTAVVRCSCRPSDERD